MQVLRQAVEYIWRTVAQEVKDEVTIVYEVIGYYTNEMKDAREYRQKMCEINSRLTKARSYQEWRLIAQEYDRLPCVQEKINSVHSPFYDHIYIAELLKCLRETRERNKIDKLVSVLRSHSYRNVGNINSPLLFREAYNSSRKLLTDFQEQFIRCLRRVRDSDELTLAKKREFFGEMKHAVGRTALLLSGGAIMGMYHIGVVQALLQADCVPKVIAGSSAGSIIAAIFATRNKEDFFDGTKYNFKAFAAKKKGSFWRKLKRVGSSGYLMDIKVLEQFLQDNLGDTTFQEAFDRFGSILNITVTGTTQHDEDRLLNYLTAPNMMIWSASAASCAIPLLFGATDLYCKDTDGSKYKFTLMNRKFLDGSIGHDLPMNKISVFFNVNNFVVSQTNPWVIPFMDYTEEFRTITNPVLMQLLIASHKLKDFVLSEVRHRASQLCYVFPSAITKFLNLFTQSYVGNITIWPVPAVTDYLRILENPTDFQMIASFVQNGRLRTYPKIFQIKSSMFLEKQIDGCYKEIKKQFKQAQIRQLQEAIDSDESQREVRRPKPLRNQSFNVPRENSYAN